MAKSATESMMAPQRLHTYQNHTLDSTRWDAYKPRDDDIIIATPYKSGTTWTQEIVLHLVFLDQRVPFREEVSPWLDARFGPLEEVITSLENQQHRRFIKTHLALDGLPYYPQVKYIVVGRDPRDVFMSMWNHYSGFSEEWLQRRSDVLGLVGEPLPLPPDDIHEHWHNWISRGWFEWEEEGYPWWGNMHHVQSWWDYRHLPNLFFMHFADMLADTAGQVRRVADFLAIEASDEQISQIAQATSLTAMRTRAEHHEEKNPDKPSVFVEGARTFFYKGTNGRWKSVLSEAELNQYDAKAAAVLTPDCRAWLEQGIAALEG
jgi:aryl sulfotransferase